MDEAEYIKKYKAIDFNMKMQRQITYSAMKKSLIEVVNEMFKKEDD